MPDIDALIEASSLGTPGAKALRARTPPEIARRIVAKSKTLQHPPVRILVTGSRSCTDEQASMIREHLRAVIMRYRPPVVVVHGQCPNGGVDLVAHRLAEVHPDAEPEPHAADWGRHGRRAGPLRNQAMVELGATLCLAFPAPGSRGTWDCVRRAAEAGIPVEVWPLSLAPSRSMPETAPDSPLPTERLPLVGQDALAQSGDL